MKKQSNNLQNSIGKVQLENLTSTGTNHLAAVFIQSNCKVFTAADLWNIQRRGISGLHRRHSF